MKKFVGTVNGKTFDNEKDFSEVAAKAIASCDGDLTISSYYEDASERFDETCEDEAPCEEDVEVDASKVVDIVDVLIKDDATPHVLSNGNLEYDVPVAIYKKLKEASNKEELKENVKGCLDVINSEKKCEEKNSHELQKEIEKLQDKLFESDMKVKDLNAKRRYLNTVLDILGDEDDEEEERVRPCLYRTLPLGTRPYFLDLFKLLDVW